MGLQTYPPTSGTVEVIHTGPRDGASFTSLFTGADGAPTLPTEFYTFDLTGTDLEDAYPVVSVYHLDQLVLTDVEVTGTLISIQFVESIDPVELRIKAVV